MLNNIEMEKFIIDRTDNPYLLKSILNVINTEGDYLTLEYNDFDGTKKQISVHKSDGEMYTEDAILRRKKELAIRNIISLMEYNNITIDDLKK